MSHRALSAPWWAYNRTNHAPAPNPAAKRNHLLENSLHLPSGVVNPFDSAPATKAFSGLKRPCDAFRKKSSRLAAIYETQYYSPETDGCMGTTRRDPAELDPYRALLDRLHDQQRTLPKSLKMKRPSCGIDPGMKKGTPLMLGALSCIWSSGSSLNLQPIKLLQLFRLYAQVLQRLALGGVVERFHQER